MLTFFLETITRDVLEYDIKIKQSTPKKKGEMDRGEYY